MSRAVALTLVLLGVAGFGSQMGEPPSSASTIVSIPASVGYVPAVQNRACNSVAVDLPSRIPLFPGSTFFRLWECHRLVVGRLSITLVDGRPVRPGTPRAGWRSLG